MFKKLKDSLNETSDLLLDKVTQTGEMLREKVDQTEEIIRDRASQTGDALRDKVNQMSEAAKEAALRLINDWIDVLPQIEGYGLKIVSFCVATSISPSLEVELKGKMANFTDEQLKAIIEENQSNPTVKFFFNVLATSLNFYQRSKASVKDPLYVQMIITLSPEIKVFVGEPKLV
jgi:gas vesicle protein